MVARPTVFAKRFVIARAAFASRVFLLSEEVDSTERLEQPYLDEVIIATGDES